MLDLRALAAAASTRFEVWFQESYNAAVIATEAILGGLLHTVDMGDGEGDTYRADWLGGIPALREWIGEKRASEMFTHNWQVTIKDWEATVRFKLNALRDSRGDMLRPRIESMALHAARHPFQAVSDLVRLGKTTACYDGQYFFDTDHFEGSSGTQSNLLTGTGTTLAQITADFYAAWAALISFKDDQGEVMWPGGDFRPLVWAPAKGPLMSAFKTLQNESVVSLVVGSQTNNVLRGSFDVVFDPKQTDANDWAMFIPGMPIRPLLRVLREPIHYVDNFGGGSDLSNAAVWASRIAEAGVEGRDVYDYAMWQAGVLTTN